MKALINVVSSKGDYARVTIKKTIGPVVSEVSGWMMLDPEQKAKAGDTFDVPDSCNVRQEISISKKTGDEFVQLVLN